MSEWQPIETAPKDGTIIFAYWRDMPVFVAWMDGHPATESIKRNWFGWKRTLQEPGDAAGFRVLLPNRTGQLCIHGNFAPFIPSHWMPVEEPPKETK